MQQASQLRLQAGLFPATTMREVDRIGRHPSTIKQPPRIKQERKRTATHHEGGEVEDGQRGQPLHSAAVVPVVADQEVAGPGGGVAAAAWCCPREQHLPNALGTRAPRVDQPTNDGRALLHPAMSTHPPRDAHPPQPSQPSPRASAPPHLLQPPLASLPPSLALTAASRSTGPGAGRPCPQRLTER